LAYTSEEKVEQLLGQNFDNDTTPNSEAITTFIVWADSYINSYTGKSWTSAGCSVTEEYESIGERDFLSGDAWVGSQSLFLDNYPISEVTKLDWNTSSDDDPEWEEKTEDTDFIVKTKTGEIDFVNGRPNPIKRAVKVEYVYGSKSVPNSVVELSTVLVSIMALVTKGSSANAEDLGSIALGDLHVDYGGTSNSTGSGELISNLGARRDQLLSILGRS